MSEFISIPVPVGRVQEVYEVLGRPKPSPVALPVDRPEEVDEASPKGIDQESEAIPVDEELLIRAHRESPPAMMAFFDYLADNANRWVLMTEVATGIDRRPNQVAGVLGAFGRRWRNRYKRGDATWPFSAEWNWEHNQMQYNLPTSAAEMLKKHRKT